MAKTEALAQTWGVGERRSRGSQKRPATAPPARLTSRITLRYKDRVNSRSRIALVVAIALTAPATFSIGAAMLRSAAGIGWPAALVDMAFSAFGVSNSSPLPVRQAWYFGAFILAPAIAASIALFAGAALRPRVRWPLFAVTAAAALSVTFWVVWSLTDA